MSADAPGRTTAAGRGQIGCMDPIGRGTTADLWISGRRPKRPQEQGRDSMEQLSKPIRAVAVLVAAVMLAGLTGAAASSATAATSTSSSSTVQGVAQAEQVRAGTITSRVRG